MVSYDIYKNRIQKIAAVKNFIVRFRILFIILAAVIIAAISAFLIMKGMVVGGITLPERIVYGDSFDVEGSSALFSDLNYEFAVVSVGGQTADSGKRTAALSNGSDELVWSSEKPDKAGSYLVRTVTVKSFGIIGYGSPIPFKIEPKQVEFLILDETVVYGTNPDEYIFNLVGDDKLIATGLKYDFESFETTITNVCANSSSVRVVDKYGNDVTYCYDIITPEKEIRLVEREITVTPASAQFTYDGSPIEYESAINEATRAMLGEGDRAIIETVIKGSDGEELDEAPTVVGKYTVEITSVSIFKGEIDVTERYGLTFKTSEISIAKRKITIATNSAEREYDGTALSDSGFTVDGFAEGSGHVAVADEGNVSIIYAGKAQNKYTYRVNDGNGADVTENYEISYNYGVLSVLPKQVTLTTPSAEKVYDGSPLSLKEGYTLSPLAVGDTELIGKISDITNAGESENAFTYIIVDGAGNDVTYNYEVTRTWGTLKVTPRPITITTGSAEKVYDGVTLYGTQAEEGLDFSNLVEGHECVAYDVTSIIDAGSVANETKYRIYSDGTEITSNYSIEYATGTITITKRPLEIITGSGEKVYDGTPLTGRFAFDGLTYTGLADGEYGELDVAAEITDVGSERNTSTYKIYSDRGEVTYNYIIEYTGYGTMTVVPRPLTIYTGSADREYDGTPFVYTDGYYGDNLADNQNLAVDEARRAEFSSVTEVEELPTENFVYYIVEDKDGNDVTGNYTVNYDNGYIWITPFTVRITTSTSNRIYDGTPYSDTSFDFDRFTDCGHKLILDDSKEVAKVTYFANYSNNNVFTVKVVDGDGEDVSYNYSLGYSYGTISIAQRAATITTGTDTKVYDGTPLYGHSETAVPEFEGFVDGETFTVNVLYSVTYVTEDGSAEKNVTRYSVYSDGTDTTANYEITYVYGDLTITRRPLTITTATYEKEYDGTPLYGNLGADEGLSFDNLVAGEVWSSNEITAITDVNISGGEVAGIDNKTTYNIYSSGYMDTTANYEITYVYGTLTVTPREIKAITATSSRVYDGTAYHDYAWATDRLLVVAPFNHTLVPDQTRADEFSSVIYVTEGRITNVVYYVVQDADGNDISYNYSIDYSKKGEIWITKRPVTITTATDSKEYDGTPLYGDSETAVPEFYNLVDGETWEAYNITEITEVNEDPVPNIVNYIIKDSAGKDTSLNYTITYVWGELSITPREITVTTATDEWEYDGTAHQNYGWTAERLLEGEPFNHTLALDENRKDEFAYVTEVNEGKVPNTVYYIVKDSAGKDISYNYSISYVRGEISVTPREIKVVTSTDHWEYDGTAHRNLEVFSVDRLLSGEPFNHTLAPDQTRADEFSSVTYFTEGEKDNTVYYIVVDADGKDISYNYSIDYSEKGKIWITQRPLEITTGSDTKEYDGKALYGDLGEEKGLSLIGLVSGETWRADEITAITDVQISDGEVVETYNKTTYKTYSGEIETTENYLITYKYGKLKITPRKIRVTTATSSREYDGTAYHDYNYSADKLLEGAPFNHTLVPDETRKAEFASVTDVNKDTVCYNKVYYIVEDGDGKDISYNYTITYVWGTISVTPREIKVVTSTEHWVYDGTAHQNLDVFSVDRLLSGEPFNHTLTPDQTRADEFSSVTNVLDGTVPNTVYYIVKDGDGKDISYNYSIDYSVKGSIWVTPRPITITTGSDTKEYDATRLYKLDGYSAENLVLDHEIVLDMQRQADFAYALNVFDGISGLVANQLYFKVRPAGSEDEELNAIINANYEVEEYVLGKLYITRKSAEITTQSREKTYDGQPLYGIADPDDSVFEGFLQNTFATINSPEITKAGWVKNDIEYKVYDGELETTENYDIKYVYGTLTVNALAVTITTGTQSKEFDGDPFSYTAGYEAELLEGHYLEVDKSKTIASVTYVTEGEIENEVHYIIRDENATDVTENYVVTYVWGAISRTQRSITVTTATSKKIYDGTAYYDYGWTADRLLEGEPYSHTLVPDETRKAEFASVTTVPEGEVQNTVYYIVKDAEGNDISLNYSIEYDWGTISIDPRPITVTTNDAEKTYDGQPLSDGGAKGGNLVEGHTLKLSGELKSITDAGVCSNVFAVDVYNGEEKVTENYVMSYVYGNLKINPKPITVELFGTDNVTYGMAVSAYPTGVDNYSNTATIGLIDGEKLEITVKYLDKGNNTVTPKNAGKYAVVIDTAAIHGGQGNAGNYKISQLESVFEILRKDLTVTLIPADTKEYDGNAYTQSSFSAVGLEYNEQLSIAVKYYSDEKEVSAPVDAGEYRISLYTSACTIVGSGNANNNYNISCEEVYYTITPRKLTVTVKDAEREYNGVKFDYFAEGYTLTVANLLDGKTFNGSVTDENGKPISAVTAGTYKLVLDRENWSVTGDKKTNYVLDVVTDGVLEITKRNIVVNADDRTGLDGWEYSGSRVPDSFLSYSSLNANGEDEGFVNGDNTGITAIYSFTQNGNSATPIERGSYTVSVALQDDDYISQNYSITFQTGELQIINRFVTVEIDDIEQLEYDGTQFDWSLLHFTSYHRGNKNEVGFIGDDLNLYNVTYTVNDTLYAVEYRQGEIINAGYYTVTVELTPIGTDPGYVIDYIDNYFKVITREITVKVTYLDLTELDYNKSLPDTSGYEYSAFYAKDETQAGFVGSDEAKAVPNYSFYNGGERAYYYLNAGENKVYVESFTSADGLIGRNYTVIYVEENYQTLEVKPILLIIAPQDKETLYEGEPLALLPTEYNILNSNSLMAGDILEAKFDYDLQPNIRSQRVQIVSYEIKDQTSGASVKGNYEVYYTYDREAEALADYKQSSFIGKLSYNKRTVTVKQIPPEAYRNGIIYNGSIITIVSDEPLFEVIEQSGTGYGLMDGHELYVLTAVTKNKPGVNNEWLKLRAVDENGNDVTWAYDIVIEQDEDTFITVYAIPLTITVNAEVAGNYDGYLLADSEFTVTGNVLDLDLIEVTMHVSEDGTVSFTAEVFQLYGVDGTKHRDRGDYYSVTITQQQTISAFNGMEAQQ